MLRYSAILIAIWVAAASRVVAEELPDRLTIGYEHEGEIDASPAACEVTVKEVVEWDEPQLSEGVKSVCAARQAHVDAYAALQKSYKEFAKTFGEDTRLSTPEAVQNFQQMVKACIDHKTGLTTGGHNIALDIIPNQIAANCLEFGKRMLDDETAWYQGAPETHTRASP